MASLEPCFLTSLGAENSRPVIALLAGGTGRRERAERWNAGVAGGAVADEKDVVSRAEEQQVASPVEAIIPTVLVQAPGAHLRVPVRQKEAAIAFVQEEAAARGSLVGLVGRREGGLVGWG